jgi:hypothetical protein
MTGKQTNRVDALKQRGEVLREFKKQGFNQKHHQTKPLTNKQKAFVQELVKNPKQSATQAAIKTYGNGETTITEGTAQQIAHDNLMKPNIQMELAKYSNDAELTVFNLMKQSERYADNPDKEGAAHASVALSAAKDILDRVHGKAMQRTEVTTTGVTLTIDLTSALSDTPDIA